MPEPYMRSDVRCFLSSLNSVPQSEAQELTPQTARLQYSAFSSVADGAPPQLATVIDFDIPGPGGALLARLFDARAKRPPGPALLFFHGGGFVLGDLETHAALCGDIAQALDIPVISVAYRLAPESPWPAAPDDCEAAARWLAKCPDFLDRQIIGLVLAGDSAGATLAIVTAMALRDAPAAVPVVAQLCFYPVVDMEGIYRSMNDFCEGFGLTRASLEWSAKMYAADAQDIRASPMAGDLAGMPPAVVVTAGLDPARDQGRAYAGALISAGVPTVFSEASGNIHSFATLRKAIPSSQGDVAGALTALETLILVPRRDALQP